jgi:hypothetical protein
MRKLTVPLAFAVTAVLVTAVVMSTVFSPASFNAQTRTASSYAEDRAAIEDLQARYLFAVDFHDPDLYVSTFTEDGVLDYGSGDVNGRKAIKDVIAASEIVADGVGNCENRTISRSSDFKIPRHHELRVVTCYSYLSASMGSRDAALCAG